MILHCSFDLHFSNKLVILSIFYCVYWQSVDQKDPLEKEMVTNSNIIAWEISWAEEPDGLQSMGSQRVRHNLATTSPLEKCLFRSSHVLLGCPSSSFTCSPSLVMLRTLTPFYFCRLWVHSYPQIFALVVHSACSACWFFIQPTLFL